MSRTRRTFARTLNQLFKRSDMEDPKKDMTDPAMMGDPKTMGEQMDDPAMTGDPKIMDDPTMTGEPKMMGDEDEMKSDPKMRGGGGGAMTDES